MLPPSERSTPKGKNLGGGFFPYRVDKNLGSKFFPYRTDHFSEGAWLHAKPLLKNGQLYKERIKQTGSQKSCIPWQKWQKKKKLPRASIFP